MNYVSIVIKFARGNQSIDTATNLLPNFYVSSNFAGEIGLEDNIIIEWMPIIQYFPYKNQWVLQKACIKTMACAIYTYQTVAVF